MKIIIHDLDESYNEKLKAACDKVVWADGKYAPCQGCFNCWTKHPATCSMSDSLHEMCRIVGQADDLVIITDNTYGGYSSNVKNLLDRSIGASTPFSTYRGWQMHHTLRYGRKGNFKVIVYGDIADNEKKTWELMIERNRLNHGYTSTELRFTDSIDKLEVSEI
ncbi:NAD(P)H-dependent oxidoreductase [Butyrivibrio sp. AE3006]|uniref:NAD(P)H-dependent oxidoreductase n=1 Tax=Butyrivibrio sp. AE3006 TaxID=1280673 RepID=UPI00041FB63B|nr:NAD(P)H-dependent oxidoreductase [Butyrivibrio sp. AE3006]